MSKNDGKLKRGAMITERYCPKLDANTIIQIVNTADGKKERCLFAHECEANWKHRKSPD